MGGYPIPGPGGGYPHPRSGWGIPHSRSGWGGYPLPCPGGEGVLHPADGGSTPSQIWIEVPHPRSRWGYPPIQDWMGYPPQGQETEQHSEHLVYGRYASCVHTGGLSCCILVTRSFQVQVEKRFYSQELIHGLTFPKQIFPYQMERF